MFELFVQRRFNAVEMSGITHTLSIANDVVGAPRFATRIISDMPGLVQGIGDVLVRAAPAIDDHGFGDVMVVLGGGMSPLAPGPGGCVQCSGCGVPWCC
ncbi:hypothetical protein KDD17_01125 [Sulfitobacter albidus]|uniref:Uncharacterized protein n=1 Tax=Sulfitobacter albidus TaxID=2829501 RepID=A0A975PMX3_9RHOB|nr:hypothetical protein [Sulfitobacter albidus]QUJ76700.1 hypothetical protein KDD17_01125 [Sulfitobacter albidus]